jgi:hypothetical protein
VIRIPRPLLVVTVAAGAAVAVVVASLPASSAPTLAPRMTATELANGLLFNQGKAALYLTELARPMIRMTGGLRILQRSVDRRLEEHPTLAATFARDVQSGNRPKVGVGLAILARFTHQALTSEFGRVATRRIVAQAAALFGSPVVMAPNDGGSANANANAHTVIHIVLLLAVFFVALAAGLVSALGVRSSPDRLVDERLINLVAIGLQAAR